MEWKKERFNDASTYKRPCWIPIRWPPFSFYHSITGSPDFFKFFVFKCGCMLCKVLFRFQDIRYTRRVYLGLEMFSFLSLFTKKIEINDDTLWSCRITLAEYQIRLHFLPISVCFLIPTFFAAIPNVKPITFLSIFYFCVTTLVTIIRAYIALRASYRNFVTESSSEKKQQLPSTRIY